MAVTFVASSFTANNASSVTVAAPAGTTEGDVVLFLARSTRDGGVFPSGSFLTATLATGATDLFRYRLGYRVVTASEPSYTFSDGSTTNIAILAMTFRGVSNVDPVDVFSTRVAASAGTTATADSVTTSAATVVAMFFGADGFVDATIGGGQDITVAQNTEWIAGGYLTQSVAGATGSKTASLGSSIGWGGFQVALASANNAPNAPSLTAPIGGAATVDRTADVDLEGSFSDPDAGDQLSAFEVEYRLQAGGGLVQPGEISASGTTFAYTITGGTLAAGGWEWRARTRDAAGALGDWSGWEQFTAASPPAAPVITDPADAGTVNTDPYTVAWTSPAQDAYQVRTVADDGGAPDETTVYEDTGTVASTSARSASIDFPTNSRTEHVQVRIRLGGLWSAWDSHIVSVSYTVPPTPTVVVTPVDGTDTAGGYISVAITNPAPGGSEPAITGNDLRRQQSSDGGTTWTDEALIPDLFNRVAAGVAEDGTYEDYLVGDERRWIYRYQAVALGDNGTRAAGAWTT